MANGTFNLQASMTTSTAHGIHTLPGPASPNPLLSCGGDKAEDLALTGSTAQTILGVLKDAGEMLSTVPYIKSVSGVLKQLIDIRDEIKVNKQRCQALIDKTLQKSQIILEKLVEIAKSPNHEDLKRWELHLICYEELLEKIYKAMKQHKSRGTFRKLFDRGIEGLEQYDRLIESFNGDMILAGLGINIQLPQIHVEPTGTNINHYVYSPILPPKPVLMVDREDELEVMVTTLLDDKPARIAVLGGGGMGKTTLALSVLHDPRVVLHYESRYFLSCEGCTSVDMILSKLADLMGFLPENRVGQLFEKVSALFPRKSFILCLDNFETPWEPSNKRQEMEEFLKQLAAVENLALVITLRGTQRPASVLWSRPLLAPMSPISEAGSYKICEAISGTVDEYGEKLLEEMEGIPLAVTLISCLLRDEMESSQLLWNRWKKQKTEMLDTGGNGRLSKLDISIELSVYGPRMSAKKDALYILGLLALLPDGFSTSSDFLEELQQHLPEDVNVQEILDVIKKASLAHIEQSNSRYRVQMLSPICDFCIKHLLPKIPSIFIDGLRDFYTSMIKEKSDYTDPTLHETIPDELGNIRSVLLMAYQSGKVNKSIVEASVDFIQWSSYVGIIALDVIQLAIQACEAYNLVDWLAKCLSCAASIHMLQDNLDDAQTLYTRALEINQQSKNVIGEANDRQNLGELYVRREQLDGAESEFKKALILHNQVHNLFGKANDHLNLGELYFQRHQLDDAESEFKQALILHKEVHDVIGVANDKLNLGEVYFVKDQLDNAEFEFKEALSLYRQAHSSLGQANALNKLGVLYFRRDQLDNAESEFKQALVLHKHAQDALGEANDRQKLGELYFQRDLLDSAESEFKLALILHKQTHAICGEANVRQNLGVLHFRRDLLDDAESEFNQALILYKQAHAICGEANDRHNLGELHFRRDQLEDAESEFKQALILHKQAHSVLGEANDRQSLGQLYFRRDQLDDAESEYKKASALYQQVHSVHGEANVTQMLGELHLFRNELDDAEAMLTQSLTLHQQVEDSWGQGDDHNSLGDLYFLRDQLEDAENSYKAALDLLQHAQFTPGQADSLKKLGDLKFHHNQIKEAETLYKKALELHQKAGDVHGEAQDIKKLDQLYLHKE